MIVSHTEYLLLITSCGFAFFLIGLITMFWMVKTGLAKVIQFAESQDYNNDARHYDVVNSIEELLTYMKDYEKEIYKFIFKKDK